jgi:hypothetical protein
MPSTLPRGLLLPHTEFIRDGGSPTEVVSMDDFTATRVIDVPWVVRGEAYYQLLGYSKRDASLTTKISRYLPDYHPDFPWIVATKISRVQGIGKPADGVWYTLDGNDNKVARYATARLTVEYTYPRYDLLGDDEVQAQTAPSEFTRYRTLKARPSAEYLSLPSGGTFRWSEGPHTDQPFPGNRGIIVPMLEFRWRWFQVPYDCIPFNTFLDSFGTVNKTTWAGCDAGTLLLTAIDYDQTNTPYGQRAWDIEYCVKYNPHGHNNFFDAQAGGYWQASIDGNTYTEGSIPDGKLTYNEREFGNLFTAP